VIDVEHALAGHRLFLPLLLMALLWMWGPLLVLPARLLSLGLLALGGLLLRLRPVG
jgi:hypothetical protein